MAKTKVLRNIKPSANALFYGIGNASSYYKWGVANKNALEFRLHTLATSGDSRGIYARMKFGGAGGGEVIRAYASISNADAASGGTINGIHTTAEVDALCGVPHGAASALRCTIGAAAQVASTQLSGTYAALQLASNFGANNVLPTTASFIRLSKDGSVDMDTFMTIEDDQCLLGSGPSGATGDGLKVILPNGDVKYIPLLAAS